MKLKYFLLLWLFVALVCDAGAQIKRKKFNTSRCEHPPRIDAILNDKAWENAPKIEDFIQQSPVNGAE